MNFSQFAEPSLPEQFPDAVWYEYDEAANAFVTGKDGLPRKYDGVGIARDISAMAGRRALFTGPDDTVTVTWTYSPVTQTVCADLERYVEYDTVAATTVTYGDQLTLKVIVAAAGLALELEGVEVCDQNDVTAAGAIVPKVVRLEWRG